MTTSAKPDIPHRQRTTQAVHQCIPSKCAKASGNWQKCSHLSEAEHRDEDDEANDGVTDENRCWTTGSQRLARAEEKTGANGPSNGDHLDLACRQRAAEAVLEDVRRAFEFIVGDGADLVVFFLAIARRRLLAEVILAITHCKSPSCSYSGGDEDCDEMRNERVFPLLLHWWFLVIYREELPERVAMQCRRLGSGCGVTYRLYIEFDCCESNRSFRSQCPIQYTELVAG